MSDDAHALPLDPTPFHDSNGHSLAPEAAPIARQEEENPAPLVPAPAPSENRFLRGPLKYDVDTSAPQLEAGKTFSVYVRVTNPYESPVTLLGVSLPISAEFRDKDEPATGVLPSLKESFQQGLKKGILESQGRILLAQNVAPAASPDTAAAEIVLQHGNSALKRFTLRTLKSTLFMPAAYNLEFQVEYRIDGLVNQDTIQHQLNIRAPLGAVLRGAVCGAIVGSLLHTLYGFQGNPNPSLQLHEWIGFFLQTAAGILLGAVLVVAFARKKDAQPFISIEDFYGGFFVGFSAGYVGQSLLQNVLPH
jgi:hypothetical protein